jgi:tRNA(fMet)-specific endonuclease VapC
VIILDTDTLSIVQRAGSHAYEKLVKRLLGADDDVFVSIISFEEQMRGWLAFVARAKTSNQQVHAYFKLHALLDDFTRRPILDFDEACAFEFKDLWGSKLHVGTMDLKIAASALAHDALLLSRNLKDFRKVPALRVEDWTV